MGSGRRKEAKERHWIGQKEKAMWLPFKEERRDEDLPTWDWRACGMTTLRAAPPITGF